MKKIFLLITLILFSAVVLYADIFYVGDEIWCEFSSIQEGFASPLTENGDTLYVLPGGHYGPLNIGNKGLHVIAQTTNTVISDDDTDTSCIYFSTACNELTYFKGFLITGGCETYGGGIRTCFNCDRSIIFDNCEISNNTATYGGGLYLTGNANGRVDLVLEDTIIKDNIANKGGGIYCYPYVAMHMYNVVIENNIADDGGGIFSHGLSCTNSYGILFFSNSAVYNGGAIYMGGDDSNNTIDFYTLNRITMANNQSINGVGGIYIEHEDGVDLVIINSIIYGNDGSQVPEGYDITYCCIEGDYGSDEDMNIDEDPEFVDASSDDYTLHYLSPCIDAGDRSSTYDDDDESMADMGYAYHAQYRYEWPIFGSGPFSYRSNWNWLCFDLLPVTPPYENTGQNVSNTEIRWHWNEVPDSCGWFNETCGTNPWFYGLDEDNNELFDYWSGTANLSSLKGYKIYKPNDDAALFTRGLNCQYDSDVSTAANADTWVGYYINETQTAEDALPSAVLNDCVKIQTQRWATSRATTSDPWSSDPDELYLNHTDMVVLNTTSAHTFDWNYTRENTEPVIRPYAAHFEWEEEIDYLPIYVEFDPEDIPDEVAVYVAVECQGAEVVEELDCQICAYILFEESGQEIEFEFWYAGRGTKERKDSYQIHENGYPVVSNTLFTGQPGDFYTLSFNRGEVIEPVPYDFCCYPNPFNPETTVSFSLDELSEVEVVIYNVRGQKVRTLVDETFRPDDYRIAWKGNDDKGHSVGSGVYFVKLKVDNKMFTNKVILLK